jgi:hypothetical protein
MLKVARLAQEASLLAKEQWAVKKLQRQWDEELMRFRARQAARVDNLNSRTNKRAQSLHEKIFFVMRWAHPPVSSAFERLVLEYCDHLTGEVPDAEFLKLRFMKAWLEKTSGTKSEKVYNQIAELCWKLRDVLVARVQSIASTNLETAQRVEDLSVRKDVSVRWKTNVVPTTRDIYWTIWYLAKNNLEAELVRFLNSADAVHVDTKDPDHGMTALHYACQRNHFNIALLLLQAGANERIAAEEDGRTPLHFAASYGTREFVLELLASGADERAVDKFGQTALQLARQNRNKAVVKTLENWSELVPDLPGAEDDGSATAEEIPEELRGADEDIIKRMSRPLQVITRRLEALTTTTTAAVVSANSSDDKGGSAHTDQESKNEDDDARAGAEASLSSSSTHHRAPSNRIHASAADSALLMELRLCEKHARMSLNEGAI